MEYFEGYFETSSGVKLFERQWSSASTHKRLVILAHGIAEHCGRYKKFAEFLSSRGYTLATYDHRGHGKSSGRKVYVPKFDTYVDDLAAFIDRVRTRQETNEYYLFGHSMGALIALRYCLKSHDTLPEGLILSSPPFVITAGVPPLLTGMSNILGRLLPLLPTLPVDRSFISRDQEVVKVAETDHLNFHGRIPARTGSELLKTGRALLARGHQLHLPLLVLHGSGDKLADISGSIEFYNSVASEERTIYMYEGLYHETLNEIEQHRVMHDIVNWLDELYVED